MFRNKYSDRSGRHCHVDEHLLGSHAYSDKFGGSTTLLRCASAVIGDRKSSSSMLDDQYVIPLDDMCPYHQHVHLVAPQTPALIPPHVEEQTPVDGGAVVDDYRMSDQLECPDHSPGAGERLSVAAYDRLPTSYGVTARTTAPATTKRNPIRTSAANSRRSFVTFKPQTTANIVPADSPAGGARTAPSPTTGRCVMPLDLIKPSRSTAETPGVELVFGSEESDERESPNDVGAECVTLSRSTVGSEACTAV